MNIKDGAVDLRIRCARPKCNKPIKQTARESYIAYRPFCSYRCKEFNKLESMGIKN